MKLITSLKFTFISVLLALGFTSIATAQSDEAARLAELAESEGCEFPDAPEIPAADGATMEQMVGAQGAIQEYMAESNELLDCLTGITDNEELPAEDRQAAINAYNIEVSSQEELAARWNDVRTAFLESQQQ